MADENFVDMCAVCNQGVPKVTMVYQKGRVFHPQCFESQGSAFPVIDLDLAQLSAKTRIELVQMKNLKVRLDDGSLSPPKPANKKPSKKAKKKTKKVKKTKSKKSKPKRSTAKSSRKLASNRRR
ncbi:MAG: hypothetical protein FJ354_01265 [Thaumarchaeota archaeon]|nr:hypothetical protein [Nitrososphaerota archaeon]